MNRSSLIELVKDTLANPEISDNAIDSFIGIAEENMNRLLRVQDMEMCATEFTTAGKNNYGLPNDYLELSSIAYNCHPVRFVPEQSFIKQYQLETPSDDDRYYTITGGALRILPVPTVSGDMIEITYYTRVPPLTEVQHTNWVLSKYPSIYTSAVLAQGCIYLQDDERTGLFTQQFDAAIDALKLQDWNQRHSGAPLNYRIGQ